MEIKSSALLSVLRTLEKLDFPAGFLDVQKNLVIAGPNPLVMLSFRQKWFGSLIYVTRIPLSVGVLGQLGTIRSVTGIYSLYPSIPEIGKLASELGIPVTRIVIHRGV